LVAELDNSKLIYITGNFEVCHTIECHGHVENKNIILAKDMGLCQ